jgi:L-iditol 2-dehydrogenase
LCATIPRPKDSGNGTLFCREEHPCARRRKTKRSSARSPDIPVPVPGPTEVLIRMKRIGVCGSDIHVYHGKHALTPYPVVQGHEVSGVIEKVGGSVRGLAAGDAVTVQPQVTCGTCHPCRHGAYHICDSLKVMGFQTTGAGSELAVHALGRAGDVKRMKVLVLGAEPIGNLVAQAAKGLSAAQVLITDVSDFRLGKARECGIDLCVNIGKADLAGAVKEHFGEAKADLLLECVGNQQTISQAVAVARKGTDIIVVGVFGDKPVVDMGTVQDRELRLIGTLMYREPDWKKAIELVESGKIRLAPLITDHFEFADYKKAYEFIDANRERAMKVMIVVDR